jgi:hypothetical protein
MHTLPTEVVSILEAFAPLFTAPAWQRAQILLIGALLTVGRRTVASILRTAGLAQEAHFTNYHRLLNRDRWSSHRAAGILFKLLIATFVPSGPIVLGGDETLERRRGPKISKLGVYRDSVRSSRNFFVKSNGLRWVCLMLLTPIWWAKRIWALPFFSVLAPSERYDEEHGKRHKTALQRMRQMLSQVRRWLPGRVIVFVGDMAYSCLEFLDACCRHKILVVTRLRLDAALYEPAPARSPDTNKVGRPPLKGARLPSLQSIADNPKTKWHRITIKDWYGKERKLDIRTATCVWYHSGKPVVPIRWVLIRDPRGTFETQALLCTDLKVSAHQIITWYVQRWQLETTFQQVRTHLGVETQRQWTDLAIERTTPALLALYSVVTLIANMLIQKDEHIARTMVRTAAWYPKVLPTFSDALALVRRTLWQSQILTPGGFCAWVCNPDMQKPPAEMGAILADMLAYAA